MAPKLMRACTALFTLLVVSSSGPNDARAGSEAPGVGSAAEQRARLPQRLAQYKERFRDAHHAILTSTESRATIRHVGIWGGFAFGGRLRIGLAKETSGGRSRLKLVLSTGILPFMNFGGGVTEGVTRYRTENTSPAWEPAIPVYERRSTEFRGAFGLGLEKTRSLASGVDSHEVVPMVGVGAGVDAADGDLPAFRERRVNFQLPLGPSWKSVEMRGADQGLQLIGELENLLQHGGSSSETKNEINAKMNRLELLADDLGIARRR